MLSEMGRAGQEKGQSRDSWFRHSCERGATKLPSGGGGVSTGSNGGGNETGQRFVFLLLLDMNKYCISKCLQIFLQESKFEKHY